MGLKLCKCQKLFWIGNSKWLIIDSCSCCRDASTRLHSSRFRSTSSNPSRNIVSRYLWLLYGNIRRFKKDKIAMGCLGAFPWRSPRKEDLIVLTFLPKFKIIFELVWNETSACKKGSRGNSVLKAVQPGLYIRRQHWLSKSRRQEWKRSWLR